MEHPSEQSLILRSRRGDAMAFDQLMRMTARGVYARLVLMIHDRNRAEDLTQETFLRAWRSIDDLADSSKFRSWLATIARSVVLDDRRTASRRKRSTPQSLADDPIADASLPIERLEQHEQQRRLLTALQELPESYREVLSLRYLSACDREAICQQTGLSPGALRGLLGRGLKLLREKLTGCEVQS